MTPAALEQGQVGCCKEVCWAEEGEGDQMAYLDPGRRGRKSRGGPTFIRHSSSAVWFSSVSQLCLTLCDPMNRSTPGLPVHHQLPEFTQTHVHQVGDAIQPSHPLWSPSPPAPNPSSIRVFSSESALHMRWPKHWSLSFSVSPSSEHPGLSSLRMHWLGLRAVLASLNLRLHLHTAICSVSLL